MSFSPSLLTSPIKTLTGQSPTDLVIGKSQLPEVAFQSSTETVLGPPFAVTMSLYPSLLTSPIKTLLGKDPTDLVICGSHSPIVSFHSSIETLS